MRNVSVGAAGIWAIAKVRQYSITMSKVNLKMDDTVSQLLSVTEF